LNQLVQKEKRIIRGLGIKHIKKRLTNTLKNIIGLIGNRWLIKHNYPEGFRTLCLNCQFDERARLLEEKRMGRFFPGVIQGDG